MRAGGMSNVDNSDQKTISFALVLGESHASHTSYEVGTGGE
jgi:hypothetical protein